MAHTKTSYSVSVGAGQSSRPQVLKGFVLKSIGAALCGASIPAVVFYFLF